MNNKILGNLGERIAKIYLQINGYQILKCNFRCRFGEIDLIAQKGGTLHFIEVKTRTHSFIEARLSIGSVKERHIWKTAYICNTLLFSIYVFLLHCLSIASLL